MAPWCRDLGLGAPGREAIAALKRAGVIVIATATTVAVARALEAAGMDAVIAQGWEAGGHRGAHRPTEPGDGIGTLALVPQIADAVGLPVIAAAFALGACGVRIGAAFLSCPEAGTDAARRRLLLVASDTDTMVTDAFSGRRAARAKRSRFADAMAMSREAVSSRRKAL